MRVDVVDESGNPWCSGVYEMVCAPRPGDLIKFRLLAPGGWYATYGRVVHRIEHIGMEDGYRYFVYVRNQPLLPVEGERAP